MADLIKKLNESKKSLFVGLAGPGTGKSTAFKTIIDSAEYRGKRILILTFINKLVDDLTEDFKDYGNVKVSTLHSFARQKLGDIELDEDLDSIISEDYLLLEKVPIEYKDKFHEGSLSRKEMDFYAARSDFYKNEKELHSLNSVVYALNLYFNDHEDKIPQEFDLILVDEFQDFNKSEHDLVKFLNKKTRVVLVGDDNQSLYHFKNAKPELIIDLYNDPSTEEFSLDYCYRCPEVIVGATNDVIKNAKGAGYLKGRLEKKFLYPGSDEKKNEISKKYPQINFISAIQGDLLIYKLQQDIKNSVPKGEKKRILILVPSYLKQSIYEGLIGKGLNVVGVELFSDEKHNDIKHKKLIEIFETLAKRKTDNLALRKILPLYLDERQMNTLILESKKKNKKLWSCLGEKIKETIEGDIEIFKKVRRGEDVLSKLELFRLSEIFNLKNLLSKMMRGFGSIKRNAIEVELTTVMSSKGLSADLVYYVGIDDRIIFDRKTKKLSDHTICEFLVGITRAKEKLTFISLWDKDPKILKFIDVKRINTVD
jgi:superfamily I DNA/RNA helicase